MDNGVDTGTDIGYNQDNDIHEQVVKMDEQKPINDTECEHKTLIPDPDDTLGEAIYHGCANPKCGVGFYIQNKNLT